MLTEIEEAFPAHENIVWLEVMIGSDYLFVFGRS